MLLTGWGQKYAGDVAGVGDGADPGTIVGVGAGVGT